MTRSVRFSAGRSSEKATRLYGRRGVPDRVDRDARTRRGRGPSTGARRSSPRARRAAAGRAGSSGASGERRRADRGASPPRAGGGRSGAGRRGRSQGITPHGPAGPARQRRAAGPAPGGRARPARHPVRRPRAPRSAAFPAGGFPARPRRLRHGREPIHEGVPGRPPRVDGDEELARPGRAAERAREGARLQAGRRARQARGHQLHQERRADPFGSPEGIMVPRKAAAPSVVGRPSWSSAQPGGIGSPARPSSSPRSSHHAGALVDDEDGAAPPVRRGHRPRIRAEHGLQRPPGRDGGRRVGEAQPNEALRAIRSVW